MGIEARELLLRQLRESRESFDLVVDHVEEGIVLAELDGTLVHWNRAALAMHEIESLAEVQKRLPEFTATFELSTLDGRKLPVEEWPMGRVLRGEPVRGIELRVRRLDRDWQRILRYSGDRVTGREGRRLAFLAILDVTTSTLAREAMREGEERLRLANAVGGIGTYDVDHRTGSMRASPELCDIFGVPRDVPDAMAAIWGSLDPADRAHVEALIAQGTWDHPDTSAKLELRIVRPSGEPRWITWAGKRYLDVVDGERRPLRDVGAVVDVTDRRRAEQRLATRNAVSTALAESATLSGATQRVMAAICTSEGWDCGEIWQLDPEARVLRCAEVWTRPGRALAGFADATRAITFERGLGLIGRVWAKGVPESIERISEDPRFLRRELAAAHGLEGAFAFPVRTPSGFQGVVCFFGARPIAADAAMSDSFAAIGEQLGAYFERRRAEVAQARLEEQLRHAQKMEALGQLSGGIAHDFNNLLATILANVPLAREEAARGAPIGEVLDDVEIAARRARELVAQILAFARQLPERRVVTSLGAIVEETVKLLRATIPAGVAIRVQRASDLPRVYADRTSLEQVVLNLCTNAWQSIEGRGGSIDIVVDAVDLDAVGSEALQPGLRPGRYVRLCVRDTGTGMSAETLKRIFDPFFTTKPAGRGTGLGLAAVHGIVRSHEGAIVVQSELGIGTRFDVLLPATERAPESVVPRAERAVASGKGYELLFVDDEEMLVRTAQRVLGRMGYRLTTVTSASEAIAAFAREPHRYDAIITDMNMPDLSGLDLLAAVRKVRGDVPVIVVSGYAPPELRDRALALGASDVLSKPWSSADLGQAVSRALASVESHASVGAE